MATVSNAGAGMSFSNAQQGTRGMSASDWIRMKRLQGARANGYSYTQNSVSVNGVLTSTSPTFNKDIAPPNSAQILVHNSSAINVFDAVGTSKIRRPASNWTDFIASQTADYILSSQAGANQTSIVNKQTKLCSCSTTTLSTKTGNCEQCNAAAKTRITLY